MSIPLLYLILYLLIDGIMIKVIKGHEKDNLFLVFTREGGAFSLICFAGYFGGAMGWHGHYEFLLKFALLWGGISIVFGIALYFRVSNRRAEQGQDDA